MNSKRFSKLLFAMILVFAAVFAFQTLYNPGIAIKSNPSNVGMGDLHRYEAAQALSKNSVTVCNQPYVGMGDLHRYEFEQEAHTSK